MVRISGENEVKFDKIKSKMKKDIGDISNARVFIAALNHYYNELFSS
jgi:hypothetical protein